MPTTRSTPIVAETKYISISPRKPTAATPCVSSSHHDRQEFQEAIVTKAHFRADMLPKTAYAFLAITAFVFILMVLLPGLY
jgi:hypothetical protein